MGEYRKIEIAKDNGNYPKNCLEEFASMEAGTRFTTSRLKVKPIIKSGSQLKK